MHEVCQFGMRRVVLTVSIIWDEASCSDCFYRARFPVYLLAAHLVLVCGVVFWLRLTLNGPETGRRLSTVHKEFSFRISNGISMALTI